MQLIVRIVRINEHTRWLVAVGGRLVVSKKIKRLLKNKGWPSSRLRQACVAMVVAVRGN